LPPLCVRIEAATRDGVEEEDRKIDGFRLKTIGQE